MRDFLIKLFAKVETEGFLEIDVFNFWHILYVALIVGAMIVGGIYMNKATEETKNKVFSILVTVLCALYAFDFFAIPLYLTETLEGGEIFYTLDVDKLPFHICTVLCPVVAFVQFNKKFARFREPVAILAIVAPLMYITYPNGAVGGISALCYKIIQTFLYHGVLLAWGYLNLATGTVKPAFKRCYKVLIGICLIALWATVGNLTYNESYIGEGSAKHYDWFFLTGTSFGMHPALMPFAVIAAVFGVALMVYGLYYLVLHIASKKSSANVKEEETATV